MEFKFWTADVSGLSKAQVKEKLWNEVRQKADIWSQGITITDAALQTAGRGPKFREQVLGGAYNRRRKFGPELPACIFLPYGLKLTFSWDENSPYIIDIVNGKPCLTHKDQNLGVIQYAPRPKYHDKKSSDGVPFYLIGPGDFYDKIVGVTYSNECCYIERNEDCLFCNINYDKNLYNEKFGKFWRTPMQVAETVKAAFDEGVADHINITGGVIAERREIEYYMDAGEAIRNILNVDSFNGTAVIAAPTDFSNLDKLKDSGYRTAGLNLELWNRDFYKAVCPGKSNHSGGWENWVNALEYAVTVFGWGRVRSNFVAGIEPKTDTLKGFEYLCAKGVICSFNIWAPNVGSAFEGHRSPEGDWFLDLAANLAELYKKNGFTFDLIHDATGGDYRLSSDIYRIENEIFDIYEAAKSA
jgi:hypothetical protein